jgi:uncharacterized membrane protein
MTNLERSIDVDVPVRTAYDQWTQFELFPRFMEGVERIDQVGPIDTHWVTSIGGVPREFDARTTEQHPDERVAWTSVDGPRHAGVVTFHRLGVWQTRVTLQMDYEPQGAVERTGVKLGIGSHRMQGDLTRFKHYIEARPIKAGGSRGEVPRPG